MLLLLAISVLSFILMAAVFAPAFQDETGGLRPFDLNFGVSAEVVYRELPLYTDRSRMIYIGFAVADYVYPAVAQTDGATIAGINFSGEWYQSDYPDDSLSFDRTTPTGDRRAGRQ